MVAPLAPGVSVSLSTVHDLANPATSRCCKIGQGASTSAILTRLPGPGLLPNHAAPRPCGVGAIRPRSVTLNFA
jgi:hypothetical protein